MAYAGKPDEGFAGAYAIPALTDTHAHPSPLPIAGDHHHMSLLFLRHGVTRVRLMGGANLAEFTELRQQIQTGEIAGPAYLNCGPIVDGPDPLIPGARSVTSVLAATALVKALAREGADCLKLYDSLTQELVNALADEAARQGLPVIGHVPRGLGIEQSRLIDLQHMRGVHPPFDDPFAEQARLYPDFLAIWRQHNLQRISDVIDSSRRMGIAHTPTLVAIEGTLVARDWPAWQSTSNMQLWPPHLRDGLWSADVGLNPARFASEAAVEDVQYAIGQMQLTLFALYQAQVPIHTGSDANAPNLVPGGSLLRELVMLTESGLTAAQALHASGFTSARSLGFENAGTLREGSPAELAIYTQDPTQDLIHLDSMVAVVANGRLYSTQDLDHRINRFQQHYQGFSYRRVLMPSLRSLLAVLTWNR